MVSARRPLRISIPADRVFALETWMQGRRDKRREPRPVLTKQCGWCVSRLFSTKPAYFLPARNVMESLLFAMFIQSMLSLAFVEPVRCCVFGRLRLSMCSSVRHQSLAGQEASSSLKPCFGRGNNWRKNSALAGNVILST